MSNNIFDIGQYASGVPWENLTKEYQDSIDKEEYIDDPHSVPISAIEEYSGDYEYYNYPEELEDYINELIPDAHRYLVFIFKGTWDNRSGYKVVENKMECFNFNYDCSMYFKKKSPNIFKFSLHSHDVPMGADYVIFRLSEEETTDIINVSMADVISFAKKKIKLEELS